MSKRLLFILAFWVLAIFSYANFWGGFSFITSKKASITAHTVANPVILIQKRCVGTSVELFTETEEVGALQWQKNGGDIIGANQKKFTPTEAGSYKLIVGTEESNEIILSFADPIPNFSHNGKSACGSETIQFTNTSINGETYFWDFGDGATSTQKDPSHQFNAGIGGGEQIFNVKLKVYDGECKIKEITHPVTIKHLPDAKFDDFDSQTPFINCQSAGGTFNLKLTNSSSTRGINTKYEIDWGDGSTQTETTNWTSLTHNYTSSRFYDLTIKVTGNNGCENTFKQKIYNGSNPKIGSANPGNTQACGPVTYTFPINDTESNPPGTIYTVSYNDGSPDEIYTVAPASISHTFSKSSCGATTPNGSLNAFFVRITASNPCGSSTITVEPIRISMQPIASIQLSAKKVCVGNVVTAVDNSQSGQFISSGTCSTTTKQNWTITPATGWTIVGGGKLGDAEPNNNPASWGSKSLKIQFDQPGEYKIRNIVSNGCGEDFKEEIICVNPKPLASFTLPSTSGCAPFTLKAENTSNSTLPTCGTNTYEWSVTSIGDGTCDINPSLPTYIEGTTSTSEHPEFNFTKPGVYRIKLITRPTEGTCEFAESYKDVTIKGPPTAVVNLSSLSICEGGSINASATVKNCYSTTAATYEWEFPNSNTLTSTLAAPTNIVYAAKGTYTITLKVTNDCGTNTTTYTKQITVTETPKLKPITDITDCNGATFTVPNFATESGAPFTTYSWTNSDTRIGLGASGNGNITSFKGKNNSAAPITATIRVIARLGNCASTFKEFKITVNPGAQVSDAGADQNLCDVTTTTLNGSPASQGGEWTVVSNNGLPISITDKTDPKTTITGLQAGQTYKLKWTVKGYAPCPSTESFVNITVSPATVGGTTSGSNSYCGNSPSGTIALTGHTGAVVRWEKSTGGTWSTVAPSNTSASLTYTNLTTTTSYRAVVKSGNCGELFSSESKIEVKTIPVAPTVTANFEYCQSEVATVLTATGTALTWYKALPLTVGNKLFEAPTPATNAPSTVLYYVTQTVNGCESSPATITVKVNPAIANNSISADQTICLNGNHQPLVTAGIAVAGGRGIGSYIYTWQKSADGVVFTSILGTNSATYNPPSLGTTTYFRRIINSGSCESISNSVKITVQGALNNTNISGNQTICSGSIPSKIEGELPTGGNGTFTYVWAKSTTSAVAGFTDIGGETGKDYQPAALTQTTYYRRTVTSSPCSVTSNVITIKVNPIPVLEQLASQTFCSAQSVPVTTIKANITDSKVSFGWTNDNTAIGLSASGNGSVPAFTAVNATKSPITATINYYATYTDDGVACKTAEKSFVITVLPSITLTDVPDLTACNGATVAETALTNDADVFLGSAVTYRWTSSKSIGLTNGTGTTIPAFTAVNSTTAPIVSTITVTPLYTFKGKTCDGVPKDYKVTVNPTPKVAFAMADQVICTGTKTTEVALTSTTNNVTFSWTAAPVAGITGIVANGTDKITVQTLVNSTNAPIVVTYKAVASTTGDKVCGGAESIYKITVNPKPKLTVSSAAQTICSGAKPNITLNSNVAGTTFVWTVAANANITGAAAGTGNKLEQVLMNTSTSAQTITYTITPKYANNSVSCDGDPLEVVITVNPAPTVSFSKSDIEICSGDQTVDVTLSSTTVGAKITWSAVVPNGITGVIKLTGTDEISAETLVNTTGVPLTVVYTATAKTDDVNGCAGSSTTYRVKVNPPISNNNIAANETICLSATPKTLKATGTPLSGGTGTYTYKWEQKAEGEAGFTLIPNEIGAIYSPPALVKTTAYRRIVKSGTCENTSNTITITVQGTLTKINILADQTICNGEKPQILKGEMPEGGDGNFTYVWEKSTTSAFAGFTAIANTNAVDYQPTALTQTTYFRRKVSSGSCDATSNTVTVKVNPIPVVEDLPNLTVCKDINSSAIVLKANLTGSEISFGWSNDNIDIGLPASGTGDVSAFTTTNTLKKPIVGNITYFATYTDGVACKSPTKQFSITVLPSITVVTSLPDLTFCNGVKVDEVILATDADAFPGSTVSYRWTSTSNVGLSDGNGAKIPAFTAVNSADAPITTTITIVPQYHYNGKTCDGVPKEYKITVNPSPKVIFSVGNQVICSGNNAAEVSLSSATAGVTFKWTAANVAGITGLATSGTDKIPVQTLVNTTNAPITVIYRASAITSGAAVCDGAESIYEITVNPIPKLTVSSAAKTICSATQPNITLSSNVAGTTFHWSVSANANITGAADGSGNTLNQVLMNNSPLPQLVTYTIIPKYLNSAVNCDGDPVVVTITVNPVPKVNFSSIDINVCSGQLIPAVQLTSLTANANISWTAVVPAGITGVSSLLGTTSISAQTLTNTTNLPLTVIYKGVAKTDDASACSGMITEYKVTVNPIAKLTNAVLKQEICSNASSAKVVLTSNVNIATFTWTATASSANVTGFIASGTGDIPVQLLINSGPNVEKVTFNITTKAYDCDGVPSKYEILVSPSPVFSSSLASLEICSGKLFKYVPSSTTTNVTFKWTRAAVAGIINAAGSGSGVDAAGAINETLINTTINAIDVTYEYEMSINGCSSGVKYPLVVKVNPQTTAKFGLSEINGCAPFNLVIKNLNSRTLPSTYTVDFGDGSPIAVYTDTRDILHTYENESKFVKLFYITITTRNECGEAISTPFEIRVQPQGVYSKLVLNATQSFGCAPLTVDFTTTNQSTGANLFTWDFGDGSPVRQTKTVNEKLTHIYAAAGDYIVRLTATNGCSTVSTTEVITVYPEVSASFTISKVQECAEKEISFTNTSDSQFTSLWDFGDGTTSTGVNPKHIYLTPGLKTVTLRSTRIYPNGGSCTAITTRTIQILAAPVSTFTTNASALNCGPFKLQVNATGTNLSNVTWNFGEPGGNGNVIGGLAASYTYTKAGDYLVTATAYNAQGCMSVSTQIVRVTESPIAAFSTATQQFCGTSAIVNFKNETTYGSADVVSYKWLVNSNVVGTSKDFNYAFEVPIGAPLPYIFKVSLIATNMVGCSTKMEKNIQFNPFPKAVFNVVQVKGCVPFKLEINNQSLYVDQYEWYLDGVLVSTLKTPQDIILNDFNKTYTLKLLVKNQYGCTENEQITQVSTHPYLKADFTLAQDLSCNGVLNLQITNTSVGATTYAWDYGDASPIYVGTNPVHSYGKTGVYNLKLTVSNGFCTDSYTKKVTVSNAPKAAFLSDVRNGCNQLTVKFKNTSANATEYLWDFGDGTFSKEENPEHNYIYSKTAYTVKLTVKNAVGCSDESVATNFINVLPPPEAEIVITPNKIIKVPEYSFTFKAVTKENIIAYKWDFGDGQTSNKQELIHKYDRFGTYKIKLHLTNISNCTNIIEDEVTILDFPGYLFIPNAFEPENLNNDLKVFKVKGGGMATYSMKIFNKWGQLIWQTIALDDQGVPLEFWDGMDKGAFLPQGAYFWQAEATFINGGVWKGMKYGNKSETKTGVIHLIR